MSIINPTRVIFFLRMIAALILLFLAAVFFILSKDAFFSNEPTTLLYQEKNRQQKILLKESERLEQQFKFMVFEKERTQIKVKHIALLKQLINKAPFDSNLWRQLTFWQSNFHSVSTFSNDQQEVFLITQRFLLWNQTERPFLFSQCVYFVNKATVSEVKKNCRDLLKLEIKRLSAARLQRNMNLNSEQWGLILDYYSLKSDDVNG